MAHSCLSPSDPNVLRINKVFSDNLHLPKGVFINGQDLVNAIQAFMGEVGIPQDQLRHYMRGTSEKANTFKKDLASYLSEYFGMGTPILIEDSSTLKTIQDVIKENKSIINKPIADTQESRDFADTLGKALGVVIPVIKLSNKQIFIPLPNIISGESQKEVKDTPSTETKINIYAGTGENAELSNFAYRPFDDGSGIIFNTVEGAFQAAKLAYSTESGDKKEELIDKLSKATGAEARKIGREISGLNTEMWDIQSPEIMKDLIKRSFRQNPDALQKLLATGNATLTHTQDRSKWGIEFPRILMEVREELKETPNLVENQVDFIESSGSYAQRTKENADWSDITIAFALDFTTDGETLTAQQAGSTDKNFLGKREPKAGAKDKYIASQLDDNIYPEEQAKAIAEEIKKKGLPTKNIKLNIAGNGIYTLSKVTDQEGINAFITDTIQELLKLGITISEIRSGGQTGIDEAGIIAAQKLGIKASVNAPKGWKFRDSKGKDISDEAKFKARFGIQSASKTTKIDPLSISDKTEAFNVEIDTDLTKNQATWRKEHPNGIVAFRVNTRTFNTPKAVEEGIIGNPFNWKKYGLNESLEMFYNWLTTGETYGEVKATDAFRRAVVNKILTSKSDTPILYYRELDQPSHATIIGYLIQNKQLLESAPITKKSTLVKQKTLDDYVKEINDVIEKFSSTIQRGKGDTEEEREADFAKHHTYYIKDSKGRLKKVDYSVTQINEKLLGIPPYEGAETPAARIGNTFDAFVRDYFNDGNSSIYDNFSGKQVKELKKQLDLFKAALDNEFGVGRYKVITKEFPIGGYLTIDGKKKSVAGTMDMLIVTDTGDIYIYDMKTSSYDTLKPLTKRKYSGQTTFYKRLLGTSVSELADRIKGTGLLLAHTQYAKDYKNYTYKGNEIYYEGKPIYQSDAGFDISIYYKSAKPTLSQAIVPVGILDVVEELEMSPLTFAEKQALDDIPGNESASAYEQSLLDAAKESDEDNTDGQLDSEFATREVLRPVSSKEIVFIGRNMVKMVSWCCDKLSESDDYRIAFGLDKFFPEENSLVGIPGDEILKMGVDGKGFSIVWPALLDYLKNIYFNLDELEFGTTQWDKVNWIREHFTDIINAAFSELVSIEGIAVTGATPEYSEEISEMFAMEDREEDGREAYYIDSRTKSYEASMPTRLKRKLAKIGDFQVDENGQPILDENGTPVFNVDEWGYGIPKFLNKSEVINYLMHNLHYYKRASQMLNALKDLAKELPWINQVIDMLEADPQLMTMFKVAFRKNETYYNKIYQDSSKKGKKIFVSTPLNERNKVNDLIDGAKSRILSPDNIPPIFSYDSRNALGVLSVDDFILADVKDDLKAIKSAKTITRKEISALSRVLSNLGIEEVDNINIFKSKALAPQLRAVQKSLDSIVRVLEKSQKTFSFDATLKDKYVGLCINLAVAVPSRTEISAYDNHKNYMTYTDPSFIETLCDELSGKDPDAVNIFDDPESKYNTYRAFSYGPKGKRTYVSSWLRRMSEDPSVREVIQHVVRTTTDDTPYIEQSDKQYWLSLIIDYFAPTTSKYFNSRDDLRLFRMPTMSDKPAGESIQFVAEATIDPDREGFGLQEMKDAITDASFEYFLYELDRIKNVLRQLAFGQESKDIEDFHIDRNSKEGRALREKLLAGDELTISDLFDSNGNLLPFLRKTGASFRYTPMFNNLGERVVDKNGKETWKVNKIGNTIIKFLNGNSYNRASLKSQFDEFFQRGMEAEFAHFRRDLRQSVSDTELQTSVAKMTSQELTEAYLQEYFWNDYLATLNIYNLTVVDPAFFKNDIALQKRFAQVHSSTTKADVEATFLKQDGSRQRFSDGFHRTIIIEDFFEDSSLAEETKKIFKQKEREARQAGRIKEAQEYKILSETVPSYFEGFDSTDGQGFGSPTGFWKKLSMLGEFNPEFDKAMEEIRKGHFTIKNLQLCIQPFKPFMFGHVHHAGDETEGIKDELVPMQIKDSEAMLYLAGAIMQGANWNHPLRALYNFMEKTHYGYQDDMNLDTYSPSGIDTIVFHSAVKEGAFGVLDLRGKSEEEITKELEKAFLTDGTGRIMTNSYGRPQYNTDIVKVMPFESWGKQQNVPSHMRDHEQAMGSQIRILAVTDIPDDITVNNNPIIVRGKKYGKKEFLSSYFNLIREDFTQGIEEAKRALGLVGPDGNKKFSNLLKNAIVKDDKYSYQLYEAFDKIKDGKYEAAIGDPTIADKVYSIIFSVIKKKVNSEDMFGGSIVQVAPFGLSDDLGIYDGDGNRAGTEKFDANKGLIYECYITAPTAEIEEKITFSSKNYKKGLYKKKLSRKYQEGEILDMVDILNNGILTESQIELISYRIPTEDKYSMYRMRVKHFLSRTAGETIIMPKEIVPLSGTDFDIDKMYVMWRYNLSKVSKDLQSAREKMANIYEEIALNEQYNDFTEDEINAIVMEEMFKRLNSKERGALAQERKNKIFEMQWGILGHSSSVEKQLNPGNFDALKTLAAEVDPSYKSGNESLMFAHNQVKMHRKNAAGKSFVGIAALNNVSHGISSFAELSFKDFDFDFIINGVSKKILQDKEGNIKFDTVMSLFDGSRISRTLGMFVGASADNAKEAVLGSINITPTTANIAMALFRIGLPLKTVVYLLSHPLVKAAAAAAENTDSRFEETLATALEDIVKAKKLSKATVQDIAKTTNITDKALLDKIKEGNTDTADNLDIAVLAFLNNMVPYASAIADLNTITSLNSLKNSVGPDIYSTIQKEYKIRRTFSSMEKTDSKFSDSIFDLPTKVPFLKPLMDCYTDLIPSICREFSPLYQPSFRQILDSLEAGGKIRVSSMDEKTLKRILNFYLLFRASKLGLIDTSYKGRKDLIYNFPVRFFKDKAANLKDNELIQSIGVSTINKQVNLTALNIRLAGMGRERTDDLTANWDALLQSEGASKISDSLFAYMITKSGFTWSPNSASTLASSAAKEHFGKGRYQDIFVDDELWGDLEIVNFITQYARNNPKSNLWEDAQNYKFKEKDGVIIIDEADAGESLKKAIGIRNYGNLYIQIPTANPNVLTFKSVSKLGVQSKRGTPILFELDATASSEDAQGKGLTTVISKQNNEDQKKALNLETASLLNNEFEEEEDEDGEETASLAKFVDDFSKGYPELYEKVPSKLIDDIIEAGDDESYVAFLKKLVDIISKNKQFKKTYKDLLNDINETLKELCK